MRRGKGEEKLYLEIGDGVGDGKPGSPGVLLVAKRAIESLRDGTEVEGADSRCGNAVSERQEMEARCLPWRPRHLPLKSHGQLSNHSMAQLQGLLGAYDESGAFRTTGVSQKEETWFSHRGKPPGKKDPLMRSTGRSFCATSSSPSFIQWEGQIKSMVFKHFSPWPTVRNIFYITAQ